MMKRALSQFALAIVCLIAVVGGQHIYANASEGEPMLGAAVARTARRYLSVRYGEVRDGERLDCSGLVRYVFARHGVLLPRRALEQAAVGDKVELGDIQPGDLLFFGFKPGGTKVAHVGIAAGKGRMVHASTSRQQVVLDDIGTYFEDRLIAVRRVSAPMPMHEAAPNVAPPTHASPMVTASAGVGR